MATNDTVAENGSAESLDERDATALTEYMTVLADIGQARDAPGLYVVVGQNGGTYLVDTDTGACECPDHEYRDVRCKHRRRVAFATGQRAIPAWVDRVAIDPDLGEHVDGEVRFVATDGGQAVEGGDRQALTRVVCGSIAGDRLPDWAVYSAVAEASQATIERVLEGER